MEFFKSYSGNDIDLINMDESALLKTIRIPKNLLFFPFISFETYNLYNSLKPLLNPLFFGLCKLGPTTFLRL